MVSFLFLFTWWQFYIVQILSGPKTFLHISSVFFWSLIGNFFLFFWFLPLFDWEFSLFAFCRFFFDREFSFFVLLTFKAWRYPSCEKFGNEPQRFWLFDTSRTLSFCIWKIPFGKTSVNPQLLSCRVVKLERFAKDFGTFWYFGKIWIIVDIMITIWHLSLFFDTLSYARWVLQFLVYCVRISILVFSIMASWSYNVRL